MNFGQDFDIKLTLTSTLVNGVVAIGSVWWANPPDADCVSIVGPTQPALLPNWDACPTLHLTGCPIIPTARSEGHAAPNDRPSACMSMLNRVT